MSDKAPTEEYVRALRDAIYEPASDDGWRACRENWMKPENVRWLEERFKLRKTQRYDSKLSS